MNHMGEFYELKKQLLDKIENGPQDESKALIARVHNFIIEQQKIISEQKRQTRFKLVMELGLENIELHQQVKELETDRDKYKQAYEGLVKAL